MIRSAARIRRTFRDVVGGAKKHGETNFTLEADVPYTIVDTAHPIMQGMTNFSIKDEAFYSMTWAKSPEIHVLATAVIAADAERAETPATPERPCRRSGRTRSSSRRRRPGSPIARSSGCRGISTRISRNPQVQPMLLRGIAWAAHRSVDTLMTERPARGRRAARGTSRSGRGARAEWIGAELRGRSDLQRNSSR